MQFSMSSHHGNNKEWSLLGSALLLIMVAYPATSFSKNLSQNSSVTEPVSPAMQNRQQLSLKDKTLSKLVLLEQSHEKSPDDPGIAAKLATAYIQMARNLSDASYYRKANEVIKPWQKQPDIPGLRKKEIPADIRLVRATLSQHDHHYKDASDDLLQVIKQQPHNVQAWLTLSTIQLVQGDYEEAEVSCSALSRVASHWLASLCYSQLYSLTGSAERGYGMQQDLLARLLAQSKVRQYELRLWVTGLLAETAMRLDNAQQAEQHFKDGIKIKQDDIYILRSYSDFLLSQNRPGDVITLLKDHTDNDQLLLRLAIAVKNKGDSIWQKKLVGILDSRFENALKRHSHSHERDEALFLLEFKSSNKANQERALKLADINWQTQKEPDDTLLLLRTAIAGRKPEKIQLILDWIDKYKLQDVRVRKLIREIG